MQSSENFSLKVDVARTDEGEKMELVCKKKKVQLMGREILSSALWCVYHIPEVREYHSKNMPINVTIWIMPSGETYV